MAAVWPNGGVWRPHLRASLAKLQSCKTAEHHLPAHITRLVPEHTDTCSVVLDGAKDDEGFPPDAKDIVQTALVLERMQSTHSKSMAGKQQVCVRVCVCE